jgi:hypothetical protein
MAIGRPPKKASKQAIHTRPLYVLLFQKLPPEYSENNMLQTSLLAKTLGISRFSVYRWINGESMSPRSCTALLNIKSTQGQNNLTRDDLIPYLFND